jgi:MoaA/NifB/PqqE/SkfB family radical SAM enzyme
MYRGKIKDKTFLEISNELKLNRKKGAEGVDILGGEVFLRSDIFKIINLCRNLGYKHILITTNGYRCDNKDFIKKLINHGVSELRFSIHGHNSYLHDDLTGNKGNFVRILKAIKNLYSLNFKNISVNTTIVKDNYVYLPNILKLLNTLKISKWNIIYVGEYSLKYTPKITNVLPYLLKCLRSENINILLINIPIPCFFIKYISKLEMPTEINNQYKKFINYIYLPQELQNLKNMKRQKIDNCKNCIINNKCDGIDISYINKYGFEELKKINKYVY